MTTLKEIAETYKHWYPVKNTNDWIHVFNVDTCPECDKEALDVNSKKIGASSVDLMGAGMTMKDYYKLTEFSWCDAFCDAVCGECYYEEE